ncbi:hypothetical protein BD310DRAFT_1043569 [Dichomitus squalens]|uniref:Uncharacterized protein n=1 Tax=Dichomitus squalens TaxID=114155 RepID=A0A4Q9PBL3_9APHY|nr:hypothetical protein BD310DRAFT_1043569 [Dichomitus squalens]
MKIRLLDTWTGQFVVEDPEKIKYAILSHVWDDYEQSYQELRDIQTSYDARGRLYFSRVPVAITRRALQKTRAVTAGQSFTHFLLDVNRLQLSLSHHPLVQSGVQFLFRHTAVVDYVWWILFLSLSTIIEDASLAVFSSFPALLACIFGISLPSAFLLTVLGAFSIWDDPDLSPKIREACRVAREAGYQYLWIDSCCIDKTSSSELTEAINSMWLWYGRAQMCYAYLADVPSGKNPHEPRSAFRKSRWHKRGWTLQELIAPSGVTFLADDWTEIGGKHTLFELIEEITGIPYQALLHAKSLDEFSVAQRLSWAARRQTTREEDRAYSLLGIFNINMPTLYGEGSRAFRRLQEEIVRRIPDLSLFAWNQYIYRGCKPDQDLVQALENAQSFKTWAPFEGTSTPFGSTISDFTAGGKIKAIPHDDVFRRLGLKDLPVPEYTSTSHGIRTKLPLVPLSSALPERPTEYSSRAPLQSQWYLVILGCEHDDYPGALLGQVCYIPPSESGVEYLYHGFVKISPDPESLPEYYSLFPLSPATIARCREHIAVKTVYISKPERALAQSEDARRQPHKTVNLVLLRKTRDALRAQGYTAELRGPDEDHPNTHWLTLSNDDHRIAVEYQHTLEDEDEGQRLRLKANVKVLRPTPGLVEEMEVVSGSMKWSEWSSPQFQWYESLPIDSASDQVALSAKQLTVQLAFDWAGLSHYFLRVEVVTETLQDTAPTSPESAQAEELQASGTDDEKGAQDVEVEAEGSGGVRSTTDDARLGTVDSEGSAGRPEERSVGEEGGARSEPHGGNVDGELVEGEEGVSA